MDMLETNANDQGLPLDRSADSQPLPPASVQTFLKESDANIAAVVITDHRNEFTNQ